MATFPLTGVEILYPIVSDPILSREISPTDSKNWRVVQKPSGDINQGPLKLRVNISNMSNLLLFIRQNKGIPVDLNTPSVYPFGNNFTVSSVYILGHSRYYKENEVNYRIDISFLQIIGVS